MRISQQIFIFLAASALLLCQEKQGPREKNPEFKTELNEGPYKGASKDHLPRVVQISDNEIEVSVPLVAQKNPPHFIEAIVLATTSKIEIDSKHFNFSLNAPLVKFKVPEPEKSYLVISKCNQHDMWLVNVAPLSH